MGDGNVEVLMEDFVGKEPTNEEFFSVKPPPRHAEVAKRATPPDQRVEKIVSALRFFAEMNDGRYPEVEGIYGDLHSERK